MLLEENAFIPSALIVPCTCARCVLSRRHAIDEGDAEHHSYPPSELLRETAGTPHRSRHVTLAGMMDRSGRNGRVEGGFGRSRDGAVVYVHSELEEGGRRGCRLCDVIALNVCSLMGVWLIKQSEQAQTGSQSREHTEVAVSR